MVGMNWLDLARIGMLFAMDPFKGNERFVSGSRYTILVI